MTILDIFRLPHLEIHQSQSASRTHSTMGWAYRRPTSEKTWTPVVRIRQKPDNESVDDDITLLDYPDLGVATNGGSGYMPYGYPGGYSPNSAEHAGSFDVVSMWSNSMLVNELTTSSPVPAALASRFVRFGPNRDRAVFVFNSYGLLTLHRLRPSKGKYLLKLAHRILARFGADRPILGSEFSMEADEIAEWRLARGEDWDDVCRPFQVSKLLFDVKFPINMRLIVCIMFSLCVQSLHRLFQQVQIRVPARIQSSRAHQVSVMLNLHPPS
jgi:hypothetical protein